MNEVFLPDFSDMMKMVDEIKDLSIKRSILEYNISLAEANTVKKATTQRDYSVNNKVPSMEYIKLTYKFTGLDGEILPLREQLNILDAELCAKRTKFQLLRDMIDVWRTESANKRISLQ